MIFKRTQVLFALILTSWLAVARSDFVDITELTENWTLTNQNLTISKSNVVIPSGVYSALYGEEVLKSYNDINMRWISQDNWTYTRTFKIPHSRLPKHICNLTFHGIDTVAEIRLNNHVLGRTDNMFVRYSFDITALVKDENVLEVEIFSPIYAAKTSASNFAANLTNYPPNCPSDRYHGECNINMLRKMQSSFAGDFALAAPSMGIWKTITLECYEVAIIRDVDVAITKTNTHWNAVMTVYMDVGGAEDFYAEVKCYIFGLLEDKIVIKDYRNQRLSAKNAVITFSQKFPLSYVIPWWPNGYGSQKLYTFNFILNAWLNKDGPLEEAPTVSERSLRVGFRTIELVEQELPSRNGYTFFFRINGEDIFIKGSNIMPTHILPEKMSNMERLEHLLTSAKDAHMNMLRVWAGGIYESDNFYQLADSMGLLVWQDLMFTGAMYPVDDVFLSSVRTEVLQNVRRIAYHASLVIIAANNENELALAQNWYGTLVKQKRFEKEYRDLYLNNIVPQLKTIPGRIAPLVSTPSNGRRSEKCKYISPDPQSSRYGDVHFFVVHENGWNVNIYPTPRFVTEYGFQSLPRRVSWLRSMVEGENLMDMMLHRQHHPMSMLPIVNLVRPNLPLPLTKDLHYPDALIYMSQIAQAMALKVETEYYRSLRDSEHRTMGALYWQLNDVWVAPSWSTIDFNGNYKLAYYWSKEFFAPISVLAINDSAASAINVSVVCDHLEYHAEPFRVMVQLYKYDNLRDANYKTFDVVLKNNAVTHVGSLPKHEIFTNTTTERNTFMKFILLSGTKEISSTYFFPKSINEAQGISNPELRFYPQFKDCIHNGKVYIHDYEFIITVKRPALFVYIDIIHPEVNIFKLSRNGFVQTSGSVTVDVKFVAEKCIIFNRSDVVIKTVNDYVS